jgi:C1A family cysteine protease
METRKYGWKPELPDVRDIRFSYVRGLDLPTKVDLRDEYKHIYDQGTLGSCTAQALSQAYDFGRVKQGLEPTLPSRLFIYYNERVLDGTVPYDNGAYIRDGIKAMSKWGVCEEYHWPYVISKFAVKPPKQAYDDAIQSPIKQYLRLDHTNLVALKQCLALGFGFVFGFSVYDAFEGPDVASTGILNMPESRERLRGGHAVFCVGYDDDTRRFIVRNSWGEDWGDNGHFYMPYAYMIHKDLAADFWTIRLV